MTTEAQINLSLTENAKIISIYGNSEFCTVLEGDKLYLLKSTIISKYNVIASMAIDKTVTIYDRDKANLFVDWSHEHFGKHGEIDELPESQIKDYIVLYLESDINKLIKFDNVEFSGNFKRIFDKYSLEHKNEILKGLEKMGVYKNNKFIIPWCQAYTIGQINDSIENLRPFIKLNFKKQRYDICRMLATNKWHIFAKNGNVGTDKKLISDKEDCCFIMFDDSGDLKENSVSSKELEEIKNKITLKIKEDLQRGSGYAAANQFVKIEEDFNKKVENLVTQASDKNLFIDLEDIYYPNIDKQTERVSILIRKYSKLDKTNNIEIDSIEKELQELYEFIYNELQKAQVSLMTLQQKLK